MIEARFNGTWQGWRDCARALTSRHTPPWDILWNASAGSPGLFDSDELCGEGARLNVPRDFLECAPIVACHRSPEPWRVLYRLLFRITHGERHLLEIESDEDVLEFRRMEKSVRRDMHKMHAFVRFRRTADDDYIAWYRPDHDILHINADFFVRRFGSMRWAILTPTASAFWDAETLRFGPGAPHSAAPRDDELEDLWRTYYASVFNPARANVRAMTKELPVRHWPTLPEAALIPKLLAESSLRITAIERTHTRSATHFIPAGASLPVLRQAAAGCEGCDLRLYATQTVFGEGPVNARIVLVGEQPGDSEDLAGRPFAGPAGEVLDCALREAGIDREEVYVTNAVKHFKFIERGKRRIHERPRGPEISACRPWLEAELRLIRPDLIVCMGATAAQSALGRAVRIQSERGVFLPHHIGAEAMVTIHPSAILRIPDPVAAEAERVRLVADLRGAAARIRGLDNTMKLA